MNGGCWCRARQGVRPCLSTSSIKPTSRVHRGGARVFARPGHCGLARGPLTPHWQQGQAAAAPVNCSAAFDGKSSSSPKPSGAPRALGAVGMPPTAPAASQQLMLGGVGLRVYPGTPQPLGPSERVNGVNFALYSKHAHSVTLYLEFERDRRESVEIPLNPEINKTEDVWHICVQGVPLAGVRYGFRVSGSQGWETGLRWDPSIVASDPYAPLLSARRVFGDPSSGPSNFLGTYDFVSEMFDWEDEAMPNIPQEDVIVYEMNVRAFTRDKSSGLPEDVAGSYAGVAEKVEYLKELGVNAVELLPIHEFDELEFQRFPNSRDHMVNTWGYSTINFFAPMSRYGSGGNGAVAASRELKEMVKTLHKEGIEVYLDVVYNHTAEGGDYKANALNFRLIDSLTYYMMDLNSYVQLYNYAGCGNTVNANHPAVKELILASLRHWVTEYHIDGFRFDLASVLCRDENGAPMESPPLIRAISKDPVLSKTKLIAEPWDCGGLFQVGSFPNWDRWGEWNGRYRDSVRQFIKGSGGKSEFATRIAGSADMYRVNERKPYHSLNFVTAHDGFTLRDLVSYNEKRNHDNGEDNKDGSNDNLSWNCGIEGETSDEHVQNFRARQMKNFMFTLLISQGMPMIVMGDEYGHTRYGNNNSYGHDNHLNNFQWQQLDAHRDHFFRFVSELIHFRKSHPCLGRAEFVRRGDITWHEDRWDDPESSFLAFTLHAHGRAGGDLFIAINAHNFWVDFPLPSPPNGHGWARIVDTNLPSPADFSLENEHRIKGTYNVGPYSSIMLKSE